MPKPPLDRSNNDDRRQWRKQEVVVGAAASKTQVLFIKHEADAGSRNPALASGCETERLFSFLRAVLNAHVQTKLFQRMERLFGIGGVLCGGAGLVGADRHRDA